MDWAMLTTARVDWRADEQSPSPSMGEGLGWGCAPAGERMALIGSSAQPRFSPNVQREHSQPCPSPIEGEGFALVTAR